ncbi:WD domain protein [Pestalotiopsis sp. IQ-011]
MLTALRSLTNSATSGSFRDASAIDTGTSVRDHGERGSLKRVFSLSALRPRGPFSPGQTIIRRRPKSRPSAHSFCQLQSPTRESDAQRNNSLISDGTSNSHTTSSGPLSALTSDNNTTNKTSIDSKFSGSSSKTHSGDKKLKSTPSVIRRSKEPDMDSRDSPLEPIVETLLDHWTPTIKTVERTAAAKVYLETYYNEILSKPSSRTMRLQYLKAQLYHSDLPPQEKHARCIEFYLEETNHLRETRIIRSKSFGPTLMGLSGKFDNRYEVVKILGKGSFGVVRLVREKHPDASQMPMGRQSVFAMKVIRKSAMLRTSQEGHLRAERDFLVSSDGSNWIVPLVASFQDPANLYLVMEYMPGGDFLGLLIRENILSEPVTKFYIAEMILCIEEAHSLGCIHRDVKPDNFLVSASGHLKISDFGLAFDGHWSHDAAYYHTHRYSLVHKLGLSIEGDDQDQREGFGGTMKWARNVAEGMRKHERKEGQVGSATVNREPLLIWRNRCGNRTAARSIVGTSQYMAPEVIREGETKHNIVNHKQTFGFPARPLVSNRGMELMSWLICDKENRLCSKRYQVNDHQLPISSTFRSSRRRRYDGPSRAVHPYDAEDIKAHRWFRDIPWDRLHLIPPPFVPRLSNLEDARYFEEDEPISDWSESQADTDVEMEAETYSPQHLPMTIPNKMTTAANPFIEGPLPSVGLPPQGSRKMAEMHATLASWPKPIRIAMSQFVASPYDSMRLKRINREIDHMSPDPKDAEKLKIFVRRFGKKERKRPRDRLLRDRQTKSAVLEIRKQSAFLGYTWTRMEGRRFRRENLGPMMANGAAESTSENQIMGGIRESPSIATYRAWNGGQVRCGG